MRMQSLSFRKYRGILGSLSVVVIDLTDRMAVEVGREDDHTARRGLEQTLPTDQGVEVLTGQERLEVVEDGLIKVIDTCVDTTEAEVAGTKTQARASLRAKRKQ